MTDKKDITISNAFQKFLVESNHKPNKIYVDQGSEFYNRSMKSWLEKKNAIEMYSTHNEGKSVVPERYIKTLKLRDISNFKGKEIVRILQKRTAKNKSKRV